MIHWLVQSASDHSALRGATPPEGLLGPAELACFERLRTEKRRRDWLLGRWTAKRLLGEELERRYGVRPRHDELEIVAAPDGSPGLSADWRLALGERGNLPSPLPTPQLSISHSHDRAFCTVCDTPGLAIGCDIERVEPRAPVFVADYFTARERALVEEAPAELRDLLVTAIWSAKEAALKALRLGLTVDTRQVGCYPAVTGATGPDRWSAFPVELDPELGHAAPAAGWWRASDGFVLTVVALGAPSARQRDGARESEAVA